MSVGPRKKMVFVGGLDPAVNEEVLHAAFIPFGVIKEVHIPRDFQKSKVCINDLLLIDIFCADQHRGFGFVDFEEPDDADDAIGNYNRAIHL